MAINYSTAIKNARMQVVATALGSAGTITIGTSALDGGATGVLVQVPLANPPFTINNGVMTVAQLPRSVQAAATGTAAKAELRAGDGTVVMTGLTVGTSGADITINATEVSAGQTVQVTAGSFTHS